MERRPGSVISHYQGEIDRAIERISHNLAVKWNTSSWSKGLLSRLDMSEDKMNLAKTDPDESTVESISTEEEGTGPLSQGKNLRFPRPSLEFLAPWHYFSGLFLKFLAVGVELGHTAYTIRISSTNSFM